MQAQTSRPAPSATTPNPQALEALTAISEQVAIPLDQLARFLGRNQGEAETLVADLQQQRCARTKTYLAGESPWVWLTRKGSAQANTGLPGRTYEPQPAYLAHRRAVNEVRLHLEAREPRGIWVSEARLAGRRSNGAQIPDGVFEVRGERHAIEVELSAKTRSAYTRILSENSARYDAVIYFCSPETKRLLLRIRKDENWPKLIVRNLPGRIPRARCYRREAKRPPTSQEQKTMSLVAEQGAIRIDQIHRFLDCSPAAARDLVQGLEEANLATRSRFFEGEPEWIALTFVGNRLSGRGLTWFQPRLGGVQEWHALNELRLHFARCAPHSEWVSKRLIKKSLGRTGQVPGAEIREGGRRYAVNVRLTPNNGGTLVPRTDLQNDAYDAVIFFCATSRARIFMERLLMKHRWSKVVIRDLPNPERIVLKERLAENLVRELLGD